MIFRFNVTLILLFQLYTSIAQQVVKITDVQMIINSETHFVVQGGITSTGASLLNNNGKVTLLANSINGTSDWLDSTTTGVLNNASIGNVLFKNTSVIQQVYGKSKFDSITIQGKGINLKQSSEVRKWLGLNDGLIYFTNSSDSIYLSNGATNAISYNADSLSTTSWVHGKLSRKMNSTSLYFFPIGKILASQNLYAPIKIEKNNANAATFSVQYFPSSPVNRTAINPILSHISNQEYWEISANDYNANDDVANYLSLSWRTNSVVNANASVRDSLVIAHYYFDGSYWQWYPEYTSALSNNVVGSSSFGFIKSNKLVTDFTSPHLNFTIATISPSNILPVTILSFKGESEYCNTKLTFVTINTGNSNNLNIEYSANGINWFLLQSIFVNGNDLLPRNHIIFHSNSDLQKKYYRIKQFKNDGSIYCSNTIVVNSNCNQASVKVYPNPFQSSITLTNVEPFSSIEIYDVQGKKVASLQTTIYTQKINLQKLINGVYIIVIKKNQNIKTFKIMKHE
jgi:hypothetical protein